MDQQLADVPQEQFTALFETECDYARPRRGRIRQAVVLSVDENDVIVDLGCKRDGIVPRKNLEMLDEAYRAGLQLDRRDRRTADGPECRRGSVGEGGFRHLCGPQRRCRGARSHLRDAR